MFNGVIDTDALRVACMDALCRTEERRKQFKEAVVALKVEATVLGYGPHDINVPALSKMQLNILFHSYGSPHVPKLPFTKPVQFHVASWMIYNRLLKY